MLYPLRHIVEKYFVIIIKDSTSYLILNYNKEMYLAMYVLH